MYYRQADCQSPGQKTSNFGGFGEGMEIINISNPEIGMLPAAFW